MPLSFGKSRDEHIVRRVLAGKREEFGTLVQRHLPAVYAVAYARVANHADAEDVVQETFLSALRSLNTLRDFRKFGAWVTGIARNLGAQSRRARVREEQVRATCEVASAPVMPSVEMRETRSLVHRQLLALDPDPREVLLLHYFAGKKTREIASILGTSPAAVRKRLQRAREALGTQLMDTLGADEELAQRLDKRASRIMGAILVAAPTWKQAAAGTGTVGKTGAVVLGGLLVKKIAAVSTLVVLIGLLFAYLVLPYETGAVPDPTGEAVAPKDPLPLPNAEPTDVAPSVPGESEPEAIPEHEALPVALIQEDTTAPAVCRIVDPARSCSVSGTVRDKAGDGVSGVKVTLYCLGVGEGETHAEESEYCFHAARSHHVLQTTSGGGGVFRFSRVAFRGMAYVQVEDDTYASFKRARVSLAESGAVTNADVVVCEGELLRGRVLAANRAPVARALVRSSYGHSWAFTDAQGRFSMCLRYNRSFLTVYSAAHGSHTFSDLRPGTGTEVEFVMPGYATLRGRVFWHNGTPAKGMRVKIQGGNTTWRINEAGETVAGCTGLDATYEAPVDERGAYEITGINAGQNYVKVTVEDEGGVVHANEALGYLKPAKVTVWDAEIGDVIKIHGRILGQTSGKPILDAEFDVWAVRGGRAVASAYLRRNRRDGSYALQIPSSEGEYRICVTYSPFSHNGLDQYGKTLHLSPGDDQEIDLRIAEPFRIAVRAVDEHGDPVAGAAVEGHGPGFNGRKVGTTDAEGRFTMSGIMPDILKSETNAWMILRHPEYCEARTRSYVGNPGEVFPEEAVMLYRPASLEGQVVDSEGQPLTKMGVGIVMHYGEGAQRSLTGITNRDGLFRFPGDVPATGVTLEVTVWHDASKSKQTWTFDPVAVDAGSCIDLGALVFDPAEETDEP